MIRGITQLSCYALTFQYIFLCITVSIVFCQEVLSSWDVGCKTLHYSIFSVVSWKNHQSKLKFFFFCCTVPLFVILCMHIHILLFSSVKELACERECSRGEDYRLIKLTITDFSVGPVCILTCCFPFVFFIYSNIYLHMIIFFIFQSKREQTVIVECRGHDAARFHSIDRAHG